MGMKKKRLKYLKRKADALAAAQAVAVPEPVVEAPEPVVEEVEAKAVPKAKTKATPKKKTWGKTKAAKKE